MAGDTVPNFGKSWTVAARQSGPWSDPATWGGLMPGAGDTVVIGPGAVVVYDALSDVKLNVVSVLSGGTLRFASNSRLRATTLLNCEGGTLWTGDDWAPLEAVEIIINDVPFDGTDPLQFGHGIVNLGTWTGCGTPVTSGPVRLATEPKAGIATLTLATPVSGWRAGDVLVLADSRQLAKGTGPLDDGGQWYTPMTETPNVAAVSADGLTVTLAAPLAHDHPAARDPDGTIRFYPVVANKTRRVMVHSENPAGVRGHVITTGMGVDDLCHVEFRDLGRSLNAPWSATNQKGRYGKHSHCCMKPQTVTDCSVHNTGGPAPYRWGLVCHNTSASDFSRSVVDNWCGAGLVVGETGAETGNVFDSVLVTRVRGTMGREDDRGSNDTGHTGAGIWGRSADNVITNCVVADCYMGIVLWMEGLWDVVYPDGSHVDPTNVPLREFRGNEVYGGSAVVGMSFWGLGTAGYSPHPDARESVVEDLRVWYVSDIGYYNYKTNRLTFLRLVARGDAVQLAKNTNFTKMIYGGDYPAFGLKLVDCDIRGFRTGYDALAIGDQRIEASHFECYRNVRVTPPYWQGSADRLPPRTLTLDHVTHGLLPAVQNGDDDLGGSVVLLYATPGPCWSVVTSDRVFVYAHQGDPNANFQAFYREQDPAYVMPLSVVKADGTVTLWGCPEPNLTNAAAWVKYHVAFAGAVAPPSAAPLAGVVGLVESVSSEVS